MKFAKTSLAALMLLTISACKTDPKTSTTFAPSSTSSLISIDFCAGMTIYLSEITFTGLTDLDVKANGYFNVFSGVEASYRLDDGDLLDATPYLSVTPSISNINEYGDLNTSLEVNSIITLTYQVDTSAILGDCMEVESGVITTATRKITITEEEENYIYNGDINDGLNNITATAPLSLEVENDQHYISFDVLDEFNRTITFKIKNNIEMEKNYLLTFEAKADTYRTINTHLLGYSKANNLTTAWKKYQFVFTPRTEEKNLIFDFSLTELNFAKGKVYLKNIYLTVSEQLASEDANITGMTHGHAYIRFSDLFDVMENVSIDNSANIYYHIYRRSGEKVQTIKRSDVDVFYVYYFFETTSDLIVRKRRIDIIGDSFPIPSLIGINEISEGTPRVAFENPGNFVFDYDTLEVSLECQMIEGVVHFTYQGNPKASIKIYYLAPGDFGDVDYSLTFLLNGEELNYSLRHNQIGVILLSSPGTYTLTIKTV